MEGLIDGRRVRVGSLQGASSPLPAWVEAGLREFDAEGLSPILVTVDGEARALCGLGDPIRPDAAETASALAALGHRLAILSGDRQAVVDSVVAKLERESGRSVLFESARGGMTP